MSQRQVNDSPLTTTLTMTLIGALGALGAGLTACEVQDGWGDENGGGTTTPDPQTLPDENDPWAWPDDEEPADTGHYYAIFIEDRWDQRCATSSSGAHGADIDAVGLWDPSQSPSNPELIAWLDIADYSFDKTVCNEYGYFDVEQAVGAPDGSLNEGFYSLAGGWLIGEFDSQVEILDGYEITIHEIDDEFCGTYASCVGSERYDVYLATDLDCVNRQDFRETCLVPLTGRDSAEGSTIIPIRLQ